jgi:DNA-binding NarL/FixJ family response regulator
MATSSGEPTGAVATLTFQELRSLRLVGRGLANGDIAEKLSVATSTVRSHLKSAYRKLGLRTRAQAVSYAVRHHLT